MQDKSDTQLLLAWKAGDSKGFEALVDRYQGALLSHARALLGNGQGEQDVVQDAFIQLAGRPPELPVQVGGDRGRSGALAAWLHTVTRNGCMDVLRSETRRRRREQAAASAEATGGELDAVEARDTREQVERSLAGLPEDQREVLVLRLLGERSYQEIAAITGRKLGTVGWLISVGMKRLAVELAPLFGSAQESSSGAGAAHMQGGLS